MSGWDFWEMMDIGEKDHQDRLMQEDIATTADLLRQRIKNRTARPVEETPLKGKKPMPVFSFTEKDKIGESLASMGQGGLDVVDNTIDMAVGDVGDSDDFMDQRVVFNIPGLKNYDPNRDIVSLMSGREFHALKREDKISYMPQIHRADNPASQISYDVGRVLGGIYIARNTLGVGQYGALAGMSRAGVSVASPTSLVGRGIMKGYDITSVGALGSVLSFKPYEPRLANSLAEFVENTPYDVMMPFLDWLGADDNSKELEERFKIALESIILDVGVVGALKLFKVFKREKKLMRAELDGATPEALEQINKESVDEIVEVVDPDAPQTVPVREGLSPTGKLLDPQLEGKGMTVGPEVDEIKQIELPKETTLTDDEILNYTTPSGGKWGGRKNDRLLANRNLAEGTEVEVRPNLEKGGEITRNSGEKLNLITVHPKGNLSKAIGYDRATTLTDVSFNVDQRGRYMIGSKQKNKYPMMSGSGKLKQVEPSFQGIEANFNPMTDHLPRIVQNGYAVKSAEEAVFVDKRVILRGKITYWDEASAPKPLTKAQVEKMESTRSKNFLKNNELREDGKWYRKKDGKLIKDGNVPIEWKEIGTQTKFRPVEDLSLFHVSDDGVEVGLDVFKGMAKELANGNFKFSFPDAGKVFNTKKIKSLGARRAVNIIASNLKEELARARPAPDIQKGTDTLARIGAAGEDIASKVAVVDESMVTELLDDTADILGINKQTFHKMMAADLNDLAGIEARIHAYRILISHLSEDVAKKALSAVNNGSARQMAEVYNDWIDLEDYLRMFSEIRRTVARSVTTFKIDIPPLNTNSQLAADQTLALKQALLGQGMDERKFALMAETLDLTKSPLLRVNILSKGLQTAREKGWNGLLEFYRGMLLANVKTHVTNTLSGLIETLITPTGRYVGAVLGGDRETRLEVAAQFAGMVHAFKPAAIWALKSVAEERNILDPLMTKADGLMAPSGHSIAMKQIDVNKSLWHPMNWGTVAVNSVGKVSRGSLRLLGGEDEFWKQLNYRSKAYAKIIRNMPEQMSSANKIQRDAYINKELGKYFDNLGMATDKKLLQYAREITFTEELMPGGLASGISSIAKRAPVVQLFLPFIRTPSNIMIRGWQRTPLLNRLNKKHQQMINSGDPQLIAQARGNTAMGAMMYMATLGCIMDGRVTGAGPSDPDRNKLWRQAGTQPYSIRMGDKWVSYNRLDPIMLPFVFVTSMYESAYLYSDHPDELGEGAINATMAFAHAFTDRTYLQGMKQVFELFQAASNEDGTRVAKAGQKMALSFVPAIINQTHDVGKEIGLFKGAEGFREALNFQERFQRKIEPFSQYNAIKHNWLTGEPVVSPAGYNTGIPVESRGPDKYLQELVRMNKSIDPPDTKIGNVELTGQQYADLNKYIGQVRLGGRTLQETLREYMRRDDYAFDPNRRYNPMYDNWRVKGVTKIIRKYKNAGKKILMLRNKDLMNKIQEDRIDKARVLMGMDQLFDLNQR